MCSYLTPITTVAEVVAAQRQADIEDAVKAAYRAGATRDTLLMAVEVARQVVEVPGPVVARAYATVHQWSWMAARRQAPRLGMVPQAA